MMPGGFCGCLIKARGHQDVVPLLRRMAGASEQGDDGQLMSPQAGLAQLGASDPGGKQVLAAEGPFAIAFSGELYNAPQLRGLLGVEAGPADQCSDALLALRCFVQLGSACFANFEGPFALAIMDTRDGSLTLVRDKFGQKPLYYFQDEEALLFATSIRGILNSGRVRRAINQQAMMQYFQLTYIPAPLTIFQGILKLLPATYLSWPAGASKAKSEKYWSLSVDGDEMLQDQAYIKGLLREAVFAAVERRLGQHEEQGCFLSGGIDSSLVCAVASKISSKPLHTFTIGYQEKKYDERSLAKLVADRYHTHHHVLLMDEERAMASVEAIMGVMEEPYADSSLIAAHALSAYAKPYLDHVLTGDAGDELFAGYTKYLIGYYADIYLKLPGFVRSGLIEPALRLLPVNSVFARKAGKVVSNAHQGVYEQRRQLMCLGFNQRELSGLLRDSAGLDDSLGFMRPYYDALDGVADEITRAQYLDLHVVLEGDMFPKAQLSAMATGLGTRPPLIDSSVVALAYRIPSAYKIRRNQLKLILKESFEYLLPHELLSAPKRGFAVPVEDWLKGALRPLLAELTEEGYLQQQGVFHPVALAAAIAEHQQGKRNRFSELWSVFVFQSWYRRWMA